MCGLGNRAIRDQGFSHGSLDRTKSMATLVKTYFGLGRMHIHVYGRSGHIQEQNRYGEPAGRQKGVIRLNNRISQAMILDPAAVDE